MRADSKILPEEEGVDLAVEVFRMLADATRLRLLWLMTSGEVGVGDLATALDKPPALVSQHLAKLRMARLVLTRRSGNQVFYRLANDHGHGHGHGHSSGAGGWWARLRHAVVPHAHDHHDAIRTAEESSRLGIRAAWIGLAGMTATALAQVLIVAVSGSVALLADTIHNVGHAATTIPLILAFRIGMRRPDDRFSYGYRRAEDLVGLFIGLVVLVSAAWVLWESVTALVDPRPLTNLGWVLAAGLVGAAGNEAVAVQRIRAGRRIGSAALVAEGQHARADGLTSLAVVGGVLGVYAGFPRADAVVGLLIGASIVGILVASMRPVVRRLMDGVEPGVLAAMRVTALAETDVRGVDRVRARWTGHRLEGDATIRLDGGLSVTSAHAVAERVEHALLHAVDHLDAVVVHVHPDVPGHTHDDLHPLTSHHA